MERREIPSILLELYVLGELDENRKIMVEKEFGTEYLEEQRRVLEEHNRSFLQSSMPGKTTHAIKMKVWPDHNSPDNCGRERHETDGGERPADGTYRKASRRDGSRRAADRFFGRPMIIAPLAAAALLAVAVTGVVPVLRDADRFGAAGSSSASGLLGIRVKGTGSRLQVYMEEGGEPIILSEGDKVRENDVLQIKYVPGGRKYGLIFSIDGRGNVTRIFPDSGRDAAPLEPNRAELIEYGYQLDDAPSFERFFFITADNNFDCDRIVQAAEQLAQELAENENRAAQAELDLPKDIEQASLFLRKSEE